MRILGIGLFFLLGACSVAPDKGVVENYGGDIESPNGQAWIENAHLKGRLWSVADPHGLWEVGSQAMKPYFQTGDIEDFENLGTTHTFVGAPSPTTAFYRSPRFDANGLMVESRLEGYFVSNVSDGSPSNKILIYPAALKLSAAQINAVRRELGIRDGADIEALSKDLQDRYNAIVRKPSNFDFSRPFETENKPGEFRPQAIVQLP